MSIKKYTRGSITDAGGTPETEQQIEEAQPDSGVDVSEQPVPSDSVEGEEGRPE